MDRVPKHQEAKAAVIVFLDRLAKRQGWEGTKD